MKRTQARAAAMKLIYEWDMGGVGGEDTLRGLLEIDPQENECDYVQETVAGVQAQAAELDREIAAHLVGWTIDRISRVDLAILRLGVYELHKAEAPGGAVVNEAVELAKAYSEPRSASFVNGVLGSVLRARGSDA